MTRFRVVARLRGLSASCAAAAFALGGLTCTLALTPACAPAGDPALRPQARVRRAAIVRVPDRDRPLPGRTENPEQEIARLEEALANDPRAGLQIAQLYFEIAQAALESGAEERYTDNLGRAQRFLLDYLDQAPDDAGAQNQLGILAAYRGDFDGARRSFRIATQLDPVDPTAQLNLAELAVYENDLPEARRRLRLSRSRGVDEVDAKLTEVLLSWKERDLVAAKQRFDLARTISPGRVQGWNGSTEIRSFDDMAAHCCRLIFCGPYMERACGDMNQAVAVQALREETVLKELQLEIERARRIRALYERRRELQIEVDPEPPSPEASGAP